MDLEMTGRMVAMVASGQEIAVYLELDGQEQVAEKLGWIEGERAEVCLDSPESAAAAGDWRPATLAYNHEDRQIGIRYAGNRDAQPTMSRQIWLGRTASLAGSVVRLRVGNTRVVTA